MDLAVGAIVEGKVTGITKFGAFVALPEGKSGMVHISEVASTFVNDIKDFLQEGQQVKVKIINIDQAGRINLSIKKAQPQEPRQPRQERREGGFAPRQPRFQRSSAPRGRVQQAPKDPSTMSFEDKLKAFMSDSESRQADVRHATDRKNGSRRADERRKPRETSVLLLYAGARSVGRAFRHRVSGAYELRKRVRS